MKRAFGLVNVEPLRLVVVFLEARKTWNEIIRSDLKEKKMSKDVAKDRNGWKSYKRNRVTHASIENSS